MKQGIPFSGPVHFALTVYNSDATAEIVDDGGGSAADFDAPDDVVVGATTPSSLTTADADAAGNGNGVTDADKLQLQQLCEITETLMQVPLAMQAENSDGHNPPAMILNMTSGIVQRQPWKPVKSHTLEYTRTTDSGSDAVPMRPTTFTVAADGRSGTVEVGGKQVPFKRGPHPTTTNGNYDIELVARYAATDADVVRQKTKSIHFIGPECARGH